MKKIFSVVLIAALVSVFSCDKIDGPTRDTVAIDTTCHFSDDNSPVVKKVLVEDYTGHNCGNCPDGGIILNDSMRAKYGDKMVSITVHAGDYANVCPGLATCPPGAPTGSFAADYKNEAGNEWHTFFGVFFYPAGMIDRIDYPSDHLKTKDDWDQDAQARLNLPAQAKIRIQNTYTESDRKLRACIETKFLEQLSGEYKLSVVLTEDSIIDWQVWYPPHLPELVPDYVHHHVLRTALNTSFGVNVASGTTAANTTVVSGYSITIDPSWNADHCAVVAFVYNADTYEVLQAEELKIK